MSPAGDRFALDGRVAIVTGGGRGIGRALSAGLAAAGAAVVVTGRSEDACLDTVAEIERAGGRGSRCRRTSGGPRTAPAWSTRRSAAFGGIDVLVNNAGVLKPHHTVKVTEDELDEIIAVNLKGPVFLSQLALPHLEAGDGGAIVNISALGAFQPMAGIGAYCAVKAAMVNWTSTMAKEWTARGVRVNALVPGPVATDMILPRDPERRAALRRAARRRDARRPAGGPRRPGRGRDLPRQRRVRVHDRPVAVPRRRDAGLTGS